MFMKKELENNMPNAFSFSILLDSTTRLFMLWSDELMHAFIYK